jgi:GDP-4-dehydro-6-deoxy-D-mannose reductase
MRNKALITGITGFVGSHLADYLLSEGFKVYGVYRWRSRMCNIEHILDKINLIEGDMRDMVSMQYVISKVKPDYIFHLAAQSFVPTSWKAPVETLTTNIIGTCNLLEAVRTVGCDSKIQIAGSSEEYGMVYPDEVPIKETNPLRPMSPYGVSKCSADLLGRQYAESYKMNVVVTRAFNHSGPRRGDAFMTSNFAKQIAEIERGLREPIISVGNLEAERDFTDVRDIVKAYLLALQKGKPGEVYNICSGVAYKISEALELLLDCTDINVNVEIDPERMRPSDVPVLLGDSMKFRRLTRWEPHIVFSLTLHDLLDFWRLQLK